MWIRYQSRCTVTSHLLVFSARPWSLYPTPRPRTSQGHACTSFWLLSCGVTPPPPSHPSLQWHSSRRVPSCLIECPHFGLVVVSSSLDSRSAFCQDHHVGDLVRWEVWVACDRGIEMVNWLRRCLPDFLPRKSPVSKWSLGSPVDILFSMRQSHGGFRIHGWSSLCQ